MNHKTQLIYRPHIFNLHLYLIFSRPEIYTKLPFHHLISKSKLFLPSQSKIFTISKSTPKSGDNNIIMSLNKPSLQTHHEFMQGCKDSTPVRGASYEPAALFESLQS